VQQSRAAFDKGGFISSMLFNTKQPRGHKNIKPPLSKSRAAVLHACTKAVRLFDKGGFISSLLCNTNNREVTKT
jgi:hypothetical protein